MLFEKIMFNETILYYVPDIDKGLISQPIFGLIINGI